MNKIKIIPVILFLCFVINVNHAQYTSTLKLKGDLQLKDSAKVTSNLSPKSPLFAGFASFIVPGMALGQFYNEQIFKGMVHMAISGIAFGMFASGMNPGGGSDNHGTAIAGFVLFLGNWIYSTFEAIAAAEKINKQSSCRNTALIFLIN